jgi:hypothetical protein
MAKRKQINSGTVEAHTFDKGLVEDVSGKGLAPNVWTQARNATPNSVRGDLGDLGNEQSNKFCAAAPYLIIGIIHIDEDRWALFSTDETNSEVGIFSESKCAYDTVVNDPCLNFSKLHLIKGVAKENHDCTWETYFDDGNNLSRTLNIDRVPWIQECTTDASGCITCVDTDRLDCDKIRMAPLVKNPCFRLEKGPQGGELLNGSYFVVGAYMLNDQRISDYSIPSNVQALFTHLGQGQSLEVIIEDMDEEYDEFELVLVQIRSLATIAKRIGTYSTRQQRISIDIVDDRYNTVSLNLIPLRNPIVEKSDAIFRNGDYLLRSGPTDKFDFNYQPLANQINTKWVSVEYPADYYHKGGNKTNYLRDEVYSFFIRWVYNTGDKTASFHIPGLYEPGRGAGEGGKNGTGVFATDTTNVLPDEGNFNTIWYCQNTAVPDPGPVTAITLPDGGVQIAKGNMAYWESSERYDDDKPEVWNASDDPMWGSTAPAHDLCGKPIRHHKFPDNTKGLDGQGSWVSNHYNTGGSKIRIMGIQFDNIKPPLDNNGDVIENIVGWEIMRGTREGNKSITAKGMVNNMRQYILPNGSGRTGLYPNYPYNPKNNSDNLIAAAGGSLSRKHFTFHSPDTSFKDPFLNQKELKLYGEVNGKVDGKFEHPDKHPKHKLITNAAFVIGIVAGIGYALIKKNGSRTTTKREPQVNHSNLQGSGAFLGGTGTGITSVTQPTLFQASGVGQVAVLSFYTGLANAAGAANDVIIGTTKQTGISNIANALGGLGPSSWFSQLNSKSGDILDAGTGPGGGYLGGFTEESSVGGDDRQLPAIFTALAGGMSFALEMGNAADVTLRLIRALSASQQYALQYQSHCFYDKFETAAPAGQIRRALSESIYLDPDLQDLGLNHRINNLYRSRSVALEIYDDLNQCAGLDDSQVHVGTGTNPGALNWNKSQRKTVTEHQVISNATSHYGALKNRLRNQYGQIEGIVQVPVSTCMQSRTTELGDPITSTEVHFGGDTYIGRFTEKNTMFFFYNWLQGQPDYEEMDYQDYQMIAKPRFWMNSEQFEVLQAFGETVQALTTLSLTTATSIRPSQLHELDGTHTDLLVLAAKYFYLFHSGVKDFFVESELNISLRDWGDNEVERFYDPYGYSNLLAMFNTAIIKSGNFYKYDYSLSISRLYSSVTQWGNTHRRDYDAKIAENCYVYRPNRVIYSLRQNLENKKDYWKIFLPNNYMDFKSRVSAIKPINKNGAMILFENESPVQFQGSDTLQTEGDTKLTIGDGGLFSQPMQNLLNTDDSYEYGSCQNRLSVVNTASGVFWMSQNQGKIFQVQSGIKELSAFNDKWWLSTYLPYLLTKNSMFDDNPFELTDNPVAGIGCQTIYDNQAQLLYFCKKDYFVKPDLLDTITYVSGDDFLVNGMLPIKLGDPAYFNDASWTISYDPKTEQWIGHHDWHPNLLIPGKTNFLSIKEDGVWRHNDDCQSYCNYYGVDYPFEVEYATVTPQVVNTLRSVEYYMEAYKYDDNCYDRFHKLDFNFDEAVIYNSEQCSGLLKLNLAPKNDVAEIITYPQINPNFIDILFSKEEQKYRFNQFWDITADRGEFNSTAKRTIWNTEDNGYIRNLNANNLDYNKNQTERKKFRHFKNTVLLRRRVSGDTNILVSIANNKNLRSPR